MSLPKSLSLSFLDLMTCGFGGVTIVFLVLVTFFSSEESDSRSRRLLPASGNHASSLMIIVEADLAEGDAPLSIWEEGVTLDAMAEDAGVIAGASTSRLVICAANSSRAQVHVAGLATNVPLKITWCEGGWSYTWAGLYEALRVGDRQVTPRSVDSLALWPMPVSLPEGR